MDSIENRTSFDIIRYSNCWEDTEILCQALEPGKGKRFLSIGSAGDNSLALLSDGAEVVAADLSLAQLACVELRREAIRIFDHASCLLFLGIKQSDQRLEMYDVLAPRLTDISRKFWDINRNIIEIGIIHCGKFELYFEKFRSWILPLIHSSKTANQLIVHKNEEKRVRFYRETWANRRWYMLFRLFFSRFVMGRMGRDPEFFRYVDVPVSENILKRTEYALTILDSHNNPYLEYILTGNFTHSLPYYLQPHIYEQVKRYIDNLTLFHGPIQEAAKEHGHNGFDGFNLSDIFEYLNLETCRTIYSSLLVPRSCPLELANRVRAREELASSLFKKDKAFFYSAFIVEETL
jgi:S-adenosylmethionine-diacylglycerol 3-amino-3-carboxypropyl transferase